MNKRMTLIRTTAAVALLVMALPTRTDDQIGQPAINKPTAAPTSTVPPGYRLEKTVQCYEAHHPSAMGRPSLVKRHELRISMLVPQDDCLALDADGWLRVVPGQCTRASAPSFCEEKP